MSQSEFNGMSRRRFIQASAVGGAGLSLGFFKLANAAQLVSGGAAKIEYHDFGDLYRKAWTWDRVVKSTHIRANCISACSWDIYVKHGIAWREEQNTIYQSPRPDVPDMNPRGCQKGACYSDLQAESSRILYPMKRVGPRGGGQWKRLSWDEALTEIADKLIDIAVADGTEAIVHDHGTTNTGQGPETDGEMRYINAMQCSALDSYAGVSDMPIGAVQTLGMYACEGTSDDWFRSDYIVVWIGNPTYTRIPEMHFMHEARYKGAKLVVIAPDLNATAIHADFWINPKMESDAAFGLAAAKVILDENLYKKDHVIEQTDLPFLVKADGRFLRQEDLQEGGKDNIFYFWDELKQQPAMVPGSEGMDDSTSEMSLRLNGLQPALDGHFSVKLKDGSDATVTTVFRQLKDHLDRDYTLEKVAKITGIHPTVIQRFAREFAGAKAAMIFASWGACKLHHSDLMQRTMILLTALTGQQGRPGTGMHIAAWWGLPEYNTGVFSPAVMAEIPPAVMADLGKRMGRTGGPNQRDYHFALKEFTRLLSYVPLMPFLYVHGGYDKLWDRKDLADPKLPRPLGEYMKDSIAKGWTQMHPPVGTSPKALIITGSNPLRRWPAPQIAEANLWPKLELIVGVNFKMSTTCLKADYILPAAAYYEKYGIKYPQTYVPYLIMADQCVQPLGESKSEWFIFGLLMQRISQRAKQRGIGKVRGGHGRPMDLGDCYKAWSDNGKYDVNDPLSDLKWFDSFLKRNGAALAHTSTERALREGVVHIASGLQPTLEYAVCSDYKVDDTLGPYQWQVVQKKIWPTLTGRQQFLIDHEWYIEAGESLPVHKDAPDAGGDRWPLRISGGHTRWSIHSFWRDSTLLLRLQRGEPVCFMHPHDCKERGIEDGDYAKVFNDIGDFEVMVKLTSSAQPGEVIIYHAWEPYQFKDWKGQQEATASAWKALHLAGGYCHLQYHAMYSAPSHVPRAAKVEVKFARPGRRMPAIKITANAPGLKVAMPARIAS